ncbi:hypothetical protein L6452_10740 [Arctium lappa]|uniref:Uncharacterized protein n=1 Tax=Arctium lappa TaxID=4217 RepID=A0ACB9DMP6_ARCLA|nr:hypothetical protein L6452_10740 [Arctium lappa]
MLPIYPSNLNHNNNMVPSMHASKVSTTSHSTGFTHATDLGTSPNNSRMINITHCTAFDIGSSNKTDGTINRKRISIKDRARTANGKKLKTDLSVVGTEIEIDVKLSGTEHSDPIEPEAGPVSRACLEQ